MPLCTTTFEAFVEGKDPLEPISTSDMITLKIKTVFDNIGPDQQPGYVHAPNYPFLKRNKLVYLVVDSQTKERLVMMDSGVPHENFFEHEMKQRFQRAAQYSFCVKVFHDSYIGFDQEVVMSFNVIEESGPTKVADYSAEDLAAVKGPGMVQSLLDVHDCDDSDSEEDGGNEVERLQAKLKKAGLEKATEGRNDTEREEAKKKLQEASQLLHGDE